jgi:cell division protein FtsA
LTYYFWHGRKNYCRLDIGSTKVCVVVGKANNHENLEILGVGKSVSEGVHKGKIENIDQTVMAIQKAIQEAEAQSNINIKVVNAGIAGNHIQTQREAGSITRAQPNQTISVEDINRLATDMYKTLTPVGTEIIHVIPQEYTIDYKQHIMEPVGRVGVKLGADFNIITAQTAAVSHLKQCLGQLDLHLENLILESISSSMSVLSREEKEAGVAVIDIGGDTTEIAIYHENIIRHTATVPFGGSIVTSDIKKGCYIMQAQAEMLKVRFGKAIAEHARPNEVVVIPGLRGQSSKEISLHNLAQIIQARMEELVEMIYAQILRSGLDKVLTGGLVLTGGCANLSHLNNLFEWITGMPTRIGNPNEYITSAGSQLKRPEYANAVGLVLAGFRALDERENRYLKIKNQNPSHNNNLSTIARTEIKHETDKPNLLKSWWGKARKFLTDDIDDIQEY